MKNILHPGETVLFLDAAGIFPSFGKELFLHKNNTEDSFILFLFRR